MLGERDLEAGCFIYDEEGTTELINVLPEKLVMLESTSDEYHRPPGAPRKRLSNKTKDGDASRLDEGGDAKRLCLDQYTPTRESVTVNYIRVAESGQGRNGIYKPIIKFMKDREQQKWVRQVSKLIFQLCSSERKQKHTIGNTPRKKGGGGRGRPGEGFFVLPKNTSTPRVAQRTGGICILFMFTYEDGHQIAMVSSKRGVGIQRAWEIADIMIEEMKSGMLEPTHDALMARRDVELEKLHSRLG